MSTQYKNVKILKWVPVLIFFLSGASLWLLSDKKSNNVILDTFISDEINFAIDKYRTQLNSPDPLPDHPFIKFMKSVNGVPISWNTEVAPSNENNYFVYSELLGSGWIYVELFNPSDSSLNQNISNELELRMDVKLVSEQVSDGELLVGNKKYPIQLKSKGHWYQRWVLMTMFICFLWFVATGINSESSNKGFILTLLVLILMRVMFLISKIWTNLEIFQRSNEISWLFPSVGDYLINVCMCIGLILLFKKGILIKNPKVNIARILSFINGMIITSLIIHFTKTVEGFILNAGFDVDIGSIILFDTSSLVLVLSMILNQLLIAFFSIYSLHGIKSINKKSSPLLPHLIGVAGICVLFYNSISFNIAILAGFSVAYIVMMDLFVDSKRKSVIWLIWWMVIHSLFITSLVYYYGLKKDKVTKSFLLSQNFKTPDAKEVFGIKEIKSILLEEEIKQTIGTLPYPSKLESKDLISFLGKNLNQSSPWYVNHVYLLDKDLNSLVKDSKYDSYNLSRELNNSIELESGIYFNYLDKNYLLVDTIYNIINPGSPFVICAGINRFNTQTIPLDEVILIKNHQIVYPDITYFDENTTRKLTSVHEDFSTPFYLFTVYPINDTFTVINYRPKTGLIKPMSLFSYLFTLGGIITILMGLLNTRYPFILPPVHMKIDHKTSLRNKLQTGFIAMLIFSFIIIGLLTAIYFRNVLEGNEKSLANRQWAIILNEVRNEAYLSPDSHSAIVKIQNKISELSDYYDHKLNLFDNKGQISYSNDPTNRKILLPRNIYEKIIQTQDIQSVYDKGIQKSYIPLFYEGQDIFAFLSIEDPKVSGGEQSIYDFLGTLLNVYVFLFLLAGAIGIFLSNSITMPLRNLADKLKEFKLGRQNEPLKWDGNDEIGTLINDYNNLITQVQESADIIARTERDTAWREMAKQVAHEIKNPLTPMKLSLQYLQRAIQTEGVDPKPMIERVSATLIEQIDNLSNIANEFSNFAKMPKSNNEKVVLNDLVEAVHDLFRKRDDMDITLAEPINDLYVFADRNQLVRILNNLVKNAIQAIPTDRRGKINIALFQRDQYAVVEVKDNGIGIPDHMKKKVFTPNFTTKSSGTGLGLAISANIIEGFNGRIYFETIINEGTKFYVEIPLMRISEVESGVERVPLD